MIPTGFLRDRLRHQRACLAAATFMGTYNGLSADEWRSACSYTLRRMRRVRRAS